MEGSLGPSRRHIFLLPSPEQWRAQKVPVGWWRGDRAGWAGRSHLGTRRGMSLSQARWIYHTQFRPGGQSCKSSMLRQAKASGIPSALPNPPQLEQRNPWLPGQGLGGGEQLARGEGKHAALWQSGKSIAFFISTTEYYYARSPWLL